MKRNKTVVAVGIVLIVVVFASLVARNAGVATAPKASATELLDSRAPAQSVHVTEVRVGPVEAALQYSGNITPNDEVRIIPKVGGRLEKVLVDVGDPVKKGDVLARLDTDTANAQLMQAYAALYVAQAKVDQMNEGSRWEQVKQAEAGLEAAQARLDRVKLPLNQNEITMAKAAMETARTAVERAQAEYDKIAWFDGKGMLPQSVGLQQATIAYEAARAAYDEKVAGAKPEDIRQAEAGVAQARAQYNLAQAPFRDSDFRMAKAGVLQAQAVVYAAQLQVRETSVKAPMDGIISEAPMAVGAVVGPATPLFTMVSPNVEITIKVEESRLGQVKPSQNARIRVSAFPDQEFPGKVERIWPTADPADRTFQVRIVPDLQDGSMRGGMFADVSLVTESYADALLVPDDVILREGGKSYVFVVASDGKAERREITLGIEQDDQVQVTSGLVLGEQVVMAGQKALKDGDAVKVAAESGG